MKDYNSALRDLFAMLDRDGWTVKPEADWSALEVFDLKATKGDLTIIAMIITADLALSEVVADWVSSSREADQAFTKVWSGFVEKYEFIEKHGR